MNFESIQHTSLKEPKAVFKGNRSWCLLSRRAWRHLCCWIAWRTGSADSTCKSSTITCAASFSKSADGYIEGIHGQEIKLGFRWHSSVTFAWFCLQPSGDHRSDENKVDSIPILGSKCFICIGDVSSTTLLYRWRSDRLKSISRYFRTQPIDVNAEMASPSTASPKMSMTSTIPNRVQQLFANREFPANPVLTEHHFSSNWSRRIEMSEISIFDHLFHSINHFATAAPSHLLWFLAVVRFLWLRY